MTATKVVVRDIDWGSRELVDEVVEREALVAREADREGNVRMDRFVFREIERYVLDLVCC